jgi:HEAT repeat protein
MKNIIYLTLMLIIYASTYMSVKAESEKTWEEAALLTEVKPAQDHARLVQTFALKREASVRNLIDVLQNAKFPRSNRIAAANILGELRAPEAVDALIQQLTLSPELNDEKTLGTVYPCYLALTKTGLPASRKAVQHLQDEVDPLRKRLLCGIVKEVEGLSVTAFLLKSELEKSQDVKVRKNIEEALRIVLQAGL